LIDAQVADAINGLGVMRLLAITDQTRLGVDEAMEFVSLVAAVLYVLSRPRPAPDESVNGGLPSRECLRRCFNHGQCALSPPEGALRPDVAGVL